MAKFNPIDKISYDFVEAIRAEWGGDLAFTPAVRNAQRNAGWDFVDVLEVVEDGVPTNVIKEQPHETYIEFTHTTLSGRTLCVTIAYDPHLPAPCVKEVLEV